jgi:DNA invertase Pin-like site-specific DNA recombinase
LLDPDLSPLLVKRDVGESLALRPVCVHFGRLPRRGIGLIVLSMGGECLDTCNPTSKLMLTILAGAAT